MVSVTEDGNVESSHNVDIKCELQRRRHDLVSDQGRHDREKGDELVRLDSSADRRSDEPQEITYEKARATKIDAEKTFKAAKIAVDEYEQGTYKKDLQDLSAKLTVAKENLESSKNLLFFYNRWPVTVMSRRCSATRKRLPSKAAELDLDVAKTAIRVLNQYTHRKDADRIWTAPRFGRKPGWLRRRRPSSWKRIAWSGSRRKQKVPILAPTTAWSLCQRATVVRPWRWQPAADRRGRRNGPRAAIDHPPARSGADAGQVHGPRIEGRTTWRSACGPASASRIANFRAP